MNNIIAAAAKANPRAAGDYIDPDTGMLICGKCHTPKTKRHMLGDREIIVNMMCKCAAERHKAECEAQRKSDILRQRSRARQDCFGYSNRKASYTFDGDDGTDKHTMAIARGYVKEFPVMSKRGKGLLFLGEPGTGKTFAACCIANALIDEGYSVKVKTFAEIASMLQGTWDKQDIYDELCKYDLLIVDDLGAERDTSYMDEIIYNVIDTRNAVHKPVIVTSNITAKEFSEGSQDVAKNRVYSRLYEMCLPVQVKGEDRRRKQMDSETVSDMVMLLQAGGDE